LTVLENGDHLLAQDCLYGGTHELVTRDLPALGITYDFIDGSDPSSWESKVKPNTKAIYVESISNPLMGVTDQEAVIAFAKKHGLVSLIDNTFASPVNFRPAEWGFDLSLHSCTKYMNGHADIVAGAVIGRGELVERVRHKMNLFGGSLDPHTCFLLQRGIKTLALRMPRHEENGGRVARFLREHPKVARVFWPGFEDHPGHAVHKAQAGGFGALITFDVGSREAADAVLRGVRLCSLGESLGGIETLISHPASMTHAAYTQAERDELGISDGLVRISVGCEDGEDLVEDLEQALAAI
jgi:cystathionine beta-lyase/cystathionine gamma-synthase